MMPIGAIFSEDRKYRYALSRIWDTEKQKIQFVGLNPSTASEYDNDATIKKLLKITRHNGFGGFYMTNLFGIVSKDPKVLLNHPDPIGDNDKYLVHFKDVVAVVFCWGNFKEAYANRNGSSRAEEVIDMFPPHLRHCLLKNKSGSPKHPLYCYDTQTIHQW